MKVVLRADVTGKTYDKVAVISGEPVPLFLARLLSSHYSRERFRPRFLARDHCLLMLGTNLEVASRLMAPFYVRIGSTLA